jgi:hypothetical protein
VCFWAVVAAVGVVHHVHSHVAERAGNAAAARAVSERLMWACRAGDTIPYFTQEARIWRDPVVAAAKRHGPSEQTIYAWRLVVYCVAAHLDLWLIYPKAFGLKKAAPR